MRIQISTQLRPFVHNPKACCLIPRSTLQAEIYPARVRLYDHSGRLPKRICDLKLSVEGPISDFTVLQDLERGGIHVWGSTPKGFMRYHLYSQEDKAILFSEKTPEGWEIIGESDRLIIYSFHEGFKPIALPSTERLFLGIEKKQDWQRILQRKDLREILPVLLRLGLLLDHKYPFVPQSTSGNLLKQCHKSIMAKENDKIGFHISNFISAAFSGILVPRWEDDDYQGFVETSELQKEISPLSLLNEASALIRSLFVREENGKIDLLVSLPKEFHSGRYLSVPCGDFGIIDLEWTKKSFRRAIFKSLKEGEVNFHFHQGIKKVRLRKDFKDKGSWIFSNEPVHIQTGKIYFLDNAQG